MASAHIIKNTIKNNEDLNSDTPIKNKAGLCTFKYKLKIKVATSIIQNKISTVIFNL